MPRWVRVLLAVAGVVLVAVVLAQVLGGGRHGPSRHTGSGVVTVVR